VDEVIKRYKLNHMNMQSAQVNQIALQLKDKILEVQKYYDGMTSKQAQALTGSPICYNDLITPEDREFWNYLCRKDFRRIDKLMTVSMGDGIFLDDSEEDEDDDRGHNEEHKKQTHERDSELDQMFGHLDSRN